MHQIVARHLRENPKKVIQYGIDNITRWRRQGVDCTAFDEWLEALTDKNTNQVLAILEGTDERSTRLRQSSPFPGVVTDEERQRILKTA